MAPSVDGNDPGSVNDQPNERGIYEALKYKADLPSPLDNFTQRSQPAQRLQIEFAPDSDSSVGVRSLIDPINR